MEVRQVHQRVGGDAHAGAGGLVVADHVGVGGLEHVDESSRASSSATREDEPVAQQVEDHRAQVAVLDLAERLPGGHALEAGRAVHREHAREGGAEQQVGLVDLERDPRALGLRAAPAGGSAPGGPCAAGTAAAPWPTPRRRSRRRRRRRARRGCGSPRRSTASTGWRRIASSLGWPVSFCSLLTGLSSRGTNWPRAWLSWSGSCSPKNIAGGGELDVGADRAHHLAAEVLGRGQQQRPHVPQRRPSPGRSSRPSPCRRSRPGAGSGPSSPGSSRPRGPP